jgi:hypothetical protein
VINLVKQLCGSRNKYILASVKYDKTSNYYLNQNLKDTMLKFPIMILMFSEQEMEHVWFREPVL